MTLESTIRIPESIKENIYRYRFSSFLKSVGQPYSGSTLQLTERIESNLGNEPFQERFLEFITKEISNGKNRQMFLSRFELSNLNVLKNFMSVQSNLAASSLPYENFNNLLKEDVENNELVYLQIDRDSSDPNKVTNIKMCFYKEILTSEEGESVTEKFTDYIWVEINTSMQWVLIKIRPHSKQYFTNYHTSKRTYEDVLFNLKQIFPLQLINMLYTKEVLYSIFKEFTEVAEQPYRDKINEYSKMIEDFQTRLLPEIGIKVEADIADITTRYKRLLERSLIVNDIDSYLSYNTGRKGIVERIALTDLSGASANVLSGDSDGLDVANIYFDIRETIDEMKKLDKLWVKWFLFESDVEEEQVEIFEDEEDETETVDDDINTIETRFEVNKDYVIINFVRKLWVSQEVQDYVLSAFIEFEEETN